MVQYGMNGKQIGLVLMKKKLVEEEFVVEEGPAGEEEEVLQLKQLLRRLLTNHVMV